MCTHMYVFFKVFLCVDSFPGLTWVAQPMHKVKASKRVANPLNLQVMWGHDDLEHKSERQVSWLHRRHCHVHCYDCTTETSRSQDRGSDGRYDRNAT